MMNKEKPTSSTDPPAPASAAETTAASGAADRNRKLRRAQRHQVTPVPARLEALLPEDHVARLIWQAVERLAPVNTR